MSYIFCVDNFYSFASLTLLLRKNLMREYLNGYDLRIFRVKDFGLIEFGQKI